MARYHLTTVRSRGAEWHAYYTATARGILRRYYRNASASAWRSLVGKSRSDGAAPRTNRAAPCLRSATFTDNS